MGNLLHRGKWLRSGLVNLKEVVRAQIIRLRSGRPKDVTNQEIIEKISDIVLDDSKVKMRELAEAEGISIGSVVKILHDNLGIRKLTAK